MKTYTAKLGKMKREWYLLDAQGMILGRLASSAATILRGKHKVEYTPNFDMGDFVVIINAKDIKFSGKKLEQKEYFHHTNYPGGLKCESLKKLLVTKPTEPLRRAISGMIPGNYFKTSQLKRLKIYSATQHKHTQKLIKLEY